MPRGDKSSYTKKQKRKAEHIEEGYEKRGVKKKEAERRAWATVNRESGGGKKSGSGRGRKTTKVSSKRGGRIGGPRGGKAAASRSTADRSRSAKKAAATRKRNAADASALDRVTQQISALNSRLGGADKIKLDQYLSSIRDVERRIQIASTSNLVDTLARCGRWAFPTSGATTSN